MPPKSKQQSEFEKLQALWYAKLKEEGFEDCEQDEHYMKVASANIFRHNRSEQAINARSEYYRLAEHFLNEYSFKDATEKLMWKLHSKGAGKCKIARKLKQVTGKSDRTTVSEAIAILEKIMLDRNNQSDD